MDCREYIYQRRNRCVGRLLGELESLIPEELMGDVRRAVKGRIGEYHADVLGAIEESEVKFNDYAVKIRDRLGS